MIPFTGKLFADFGELGLVAHDQSKVPGAVGRTLRRFEHGQELVLADFKERVAFAFVELLEIEHVLIERDRFFDVIDVDRDVVDAVHFDAHSRFYTCGSEIVTFVPLPGRLSRAIFPPARSTARFAIARPSPDPSPPRVPPR